MLELELQDPLCHPQQLTAPKMFRPEHTAELFRLLGSWPPYIFLFCKLLGGRA